MRYAAAAVMVVFLAGACATGWKQEQDANRKGLRTLSVGMQQEEVTEVMQGPPDLTEAFQEGESESFEVWYYYTNRRRADGNRTKDEMTPLVFRDGKLVGWGDSFLASSLATTGSWSPSDSANEVVADTFAFPNYGTYRGSDVIRITEPNEASGDGVKRSLSATFTLTTDAGVQGTGFLIAESGLGLTNDHVVEGAAAFEAVLSDGRSVPGRVVRRGQSIDVALVQVLCEDDCPVVPTGNLTDVAQGDEVYAVGAPLGLEQSLSSGVVSAIRRMNGSLWIQTDAAINQGNSGGPLVNSTGRVIGINTAGVRKDVGEGLGFALAIDQAFNTLGLVKENR